MRYANYQAVDTACARHGLLKVPPTTTPYYHRSTRGAGRPLPLGLMLVIDCMADNKLPHHHVYFLP